jgi:hypothetical protein
MPAPSETSTAVCQLLTLWKMWLGRLALPDRLLERAAQGEGKASLSYCTLPSTSNRISISLMVLLLSLCLACYLRSHCLVQYHPCSHMSGCSNTSRRLAVKDKLPCYHPDCLGEDGQPRKFFSRKADVTRHYKSQHDITWLDCPWPKCLRKGTQGFPRKDHLTEHQRGYHQEPIPKRIGGNQPGKQAEAIPTSTDEMKAARLSGKPLPTPLPDTVVANKTAREQDSHQEQATGKRRRISQEATHPDLELRGHHTGTKSRRGNKTKDSSPSGAPVVGQHRVQWDEPSAGPVYQEDQRQQQRPALSARRANTQPQALLQRAAGYHDMEHYVHSSSMPRYYQDSEHPATRFP